MSACQLTRQTNACVRIIPRKTHVRMYTRTVEPLYFGHLGTRKDCPDYQGVLISGVEDVLWLVIMDHLAPVACLQLKGLDQRGSTV